MSRLSKRKPDMRKIRPTKTYSIAELAKCLEKSEATILKKARAWGLCIDNQQPTLVFGWAYKKAAERHWKLKKRTCDENEFLCTRCNTVVPTDPATWRVDVSSDGNRKAFATCPSCSACLFKSLKRPENLQPNAEQPDPNGQIDRFNESTISPSSDTDITASGTLLRKKNRRRGLTPVRESVLPKNPVNERLKRRYFEYRAEVLGIADATIRKDELALLEMEQSIFFKDLCTTTFEDVHAIKQAMRDRNYSISVLRSRIVTLRDFFTWFSSEEDSPAGLSALPKHFKLKRKELRQSNCPDRDTPSPTLEEVDQVLASIAETTVIDRQRKAQIAFIAMTGIRVTAMTGLCLKHVDMDKGIVYQPSTEIDTKFAKAMTTVIVPWVSQWLDILKRHIAELRSLGFGDQDPLFPKSALAMGKPKSHQLTKEHFTSHQMLWKNMSRASEVSGVERFTPHTLRNTHAKLCHHRFSNPQIAKAIGDNLGHRPRTVTGVYGTMDLATRKHVLLEFADKLQGGKSSPFS